jgi:putative hydrolase of HD superfamily
MASDYPQIVDGLVGDDMQTKGVFPLSLLADRSVAPLIELYFETNQLKRLYRQGWLKRGVRPERCESVADHIFGMAALAVFICDAYFPELDLAKVLRLVLLHEIGEVYAGDITPADGVTGAEKRRHEREAVQRVLGKLPRGGDYVAAWEEFELGDSPEACLVRELDRLEMGLQASVYDLEGGLQADEFYATAERVVTNAPLKALLSEATALRGARGR